MEEQKTGLKRNTIDKYYTKEDIVILCINLIKQNVQIKKTDLIIEPSAGNGAFINQIKLLTKNYKFYDLEPEHKEIVKQDYLELEYKTLTDKYKKIHVIGNPPFGRQSSIVIKFIKKSSEYCDTISFILPKSFKKDSLKKSFPLYFHLIFESDLPEKSFLVNNIECDVPCVFQIWQKKNTERKVQNKIEPNNFIFVDKEDNPQISVRRVGVNAGTIDKIVDTKSVQSHYFIKFTNDDTLENNIRQIEKVKFDFNNTVGPKSISKQELICKYNTVL